MKMVVLNFMLSKIMKKILLSIILLLAIPISAYAQDCEELQSNSQWMEGIQYVKSAVETKSWDEALTLQLFWK